MSDSATAYKFQFVGGDLALDFCNTMGGKRETVPNDHLVTCGDYVTWAHQAGLIDSAEARDLTRKAELFPKQAEAALRRAIEFREVLFRIFSAIIAGRQPVPGDLTALNVELSESLGRLQLTNTGNSLDWHWVNKRGAFENPLGPVAHSAAKLLTDPGRLQRLRGCCGDTCGWLFIDASKNRSRRWCDMRDCGNRAKIRRHRLKQRDECHHKHDDKSG